MWLVATVLGGTELEEGIDFRDKEKKMERVSSLMEVRTHETRVRGEKEEDDIQVSAL